MAAMGEKRRNFALLVISVLAALLLAGVRNVQPRPSVGFKFHAVLVINSVHLAAMGSPEHDRWLPLFWALDYFKDSQARDVREGDWTLGPVRAALAEAPGGLRAAASAWDGRLVMRALAGDGHPLRRLVARVLTVLRGRALPRVWQV